MPEGSRFTLPPGWALSQQCVDITSLLHCTDGVPSCTHHFLNLERLHAVVVVRVSLGVDEIPSDPKNHSYNMPKNPNIVQYFRREQPGQSRSSVRLSPLSLENIPTEVTTLIMPTSSITISFSQYQSWPPNRLPKPLCQTPGFYRPHFYIS